MHINNLGKIKIGIAAFVSAFLFTGVFASQASANEGGLKISESYVRGQLIIKFKQGEGPDGIFLEKYNLKSADKILKQYNLKNKGNKDSGVERLYVAEQAIVSDLQNVINEIEKDPRVEYAEPNYIVRADNIPNDPSFSNLWAMNNTGQTGGTADADIDATEAWDMQTGNGSTSGQVVGVIDSGIDYNHPDLSQNIWTNPGEIPGNGVDDDGNGYVDDIRGWDFYNNDNNPMDDNGHGTHVSGTIGALGNNGVGVAGVNWSVKMAALKFLNSSGSGSTAGAISALNYANAMGFKITSNSWGGGGYSQALYDAISAANTAGNLFVAAAGNDGKNTDGSPSYPASYDLPNIISVAATDHKDNLASFSNYGANSVDIGAPGVNIYSTLPGNNYGSKNGTSMATPHISGAAALVWAQFPGVNASAVNARILNGADLVPSLAGKTVTGGRLNVYNAIEPDSIPPSAISNLSSVSAGYNSVTLGWTAKGDDGDIGKASAYDIRYSTTSINDLNWDYAIKAAGEPKPQAAGSSETFKVAGLAAGSAYYFAIKSIDNVANVSALSNIAFATTAIAAVAFSDNMESGQNGWTHGGSGDNWALGTPTSGPGYSYSGVNVWATNLSGNYGTNNMNAWLASPSFSLAGFTASQVDFQHYYSTEPYYDGGIVEVSSNGGVSWTEIYPIDGYPEDALSSGNPLGAVPAFSGASGSGWRPASFNLSAYDGAANLKIRFRFGTDYSVTNYPGWYIDDFAVYGTAAPVPVNNKPVAVAGGPYAGQEAQVLTLNGSRSFDPDSNPLTYKWTFGDGGSLTSASSAVSHIYTRGGLYNITLIVNDGLVDSDPSTTTADIAEVNDAPLANAGPDKTIFLGQTAVLDGSLSSDEEGPISSYAWGFGDGALGAGATTTHAYSATGTYTVTLTVTDSGSATASDITVVNVLQEAATPTEIVVFEDSFEVGEWNGLWAEDSQNDWFRSTQRAVDGAYSAEVDGSASNAALTSIPINLQGRTNATISFSWFIESGLDLGEYLAFDISTATSGTSWVEKAWLRGNEDPENVWLRQTIVLTNISNLRIRFRGKMSLSSEDADVDSVKIIAR